MNPKSDWGVWGWSVITVLFANHGVESTKMIHLLIETMNGESFAISEWYLSDKWGRDSKAKHTVLCVSWKAVNQQHKGRTVLHIACACYCFFCVWTLLTSWHLTNLTPSYTISTSLNLRLTRLFDISGPFALLPATALQSLPWPTASAG